MNLSSTKIGNTLVSGINKEYVFDTIQKSQNFYEAAILEKWLPYMKKSDVIFDIGANIGNHSLFWALKTKAKEIHAFEPLKENFSILEKNIVDNHLGNIIHSYPLAIGDEGGQVFLKSLDETNMGSATFEKETEKSQKSVPLTTVDLVMEKNNISSVDFVKIDTESFEVKVLKGMKKALFENHPTLWIEASSSSEKSIWEILKENEYQVVDILGANILAIHPQKHPNLPSLNVEGISPQYFEHFEKRNNYYQLYIKTRDQQRDLLVSYRNVQAEIEKKKETYATLLEKSKNINNEYEEYQLQIKEEIHRLEEEKNKIQSLYYDYQAQSKIRIAELSAALASTLATEEKTKQMFYSMSRDLSEFEKQVSLYEHSFKKQIKSLLKNIVNRLRVFGIKHPLVGIPLQKVYRLFLIIYQKLKVLYRRLKNMYRRLKNKISLLGKKKG